jgi:hypothetical protein
MPAVDGPRGSTPAGAHGHDGVFLERARENWALRSNRFNRGCRAHVGKPGGETGNTRAGCATDPEGVRRAPLPLND